ncbi:MAG: NADPH-dependent oxidoreductase [Planctomycetota bacterium]|nr:MAG: NADPH-dependent oxidoreductase [Planctomycetota bacterium]
MHILVVSGTNRAGALSRKLSDIVANKHRDLGASVDLLDLGEVLNADFIAPTAYKQPTDAISGAVDRFLAADGVVFVVAEYNGSYPGALKLFVDMLPYPAGFNRRPCAFIGLAAGRFASLRAVEHFQQVAGYRNAYQYPERVLIANSYGQLSDGDFGDDELRQRIDHQASGFQAFVNKLGGEAAKQRDPA